MKRQLLLYAVFLLLANSYLYTSAQTNTFPASGNVGIGTTSPTRTLDVRGIIQSNSHVIVTNPANANASLQLNWLNNVPRLRLGGSGAGAQAGFDIQGINDKSLFRVTYDGNIGIGTANPITNSTYRILDITGASASTGGYIRLATSDASGEARILTTDNGLIFDVQQPAMAFQWRDHNGAELLRLGSDGIARWSGRSSASTEVGGNESGQFIRMTHRDGSSSFYIRGYSVGGVQAEFRSGGITVNGTFKGEEVLVVPDAWADHVLNADYRLRPLEEVRAFIDQHGHLPDIPPEEEVLQEGIHLGEMNAKLLEKIEELTLYLLEQEEELKRQETRLAGQALLIEEQAGRLAEFDQLKEAVEALAEQMELRR